MNAYFSRVIALGRGEILGLLGVALIAIGPVLGGWNWCGLWPGANFLALALAHVLGAHRVFSKSSQGVVPLWNWCLFLPLLTATLAVWHLFRLGSRAPAYSIVNDELVIGRRLLAGELHEPFVNYVDLTAEFSEPIAIRRRASYRSFPILDAAAPSPEALHAVVNGLPPGRTFVHCAQGYGRTGLFALALLLKSGAAESIEEGLQILTTARPGVCLSPAQRRCIENFVALLAKKP